MFKEAESYIYYSSDCDKDEKSLFNLIYFFCLSVLARSQTPSCAPARALHRAQSALSRAVQ